MTRPLVLTLLTLALGAPTIPAQPADRRALSLDDLARLRTLADPQVSPDGKWVAYTVAAVDTDKDKRETDLWMTSWDGARHVRLTATPDTGESKPRYSPDGRYLAFLAKRGDESEKKKGAQVWLLNTAGGEAEKLTDLKGGVDDYAWSPDSRRLALIVSDPDPADDDKDGKKSKSKTEPPLVIERYHFKQDRDGYLRDLRSHLWLFELDAKKGEALTSGQYDDAAPAWSPDGTRLAFVSQRSGPDPDRGENSDVYVIDARSGAQPRAVTTFEGQDAGRPAWSPDGRLIAYLQGDETRWSAYMLEKLAVVPAEGGPARVLTASLDRPVSGAPIWSRDGRTLSFLVTDDRTVYVGRVPAAGGPVEKLTSGARVVSALAAGAGGALAVLASTDEEPLEIHALENGALRRLSHQNDWLSEVRLATTEDFSSRSADGTEVHGLMHKPPAFEPGRKYPTLLFIHGGPNGQDQHAFYFDRQFLAGQGYVVLAVNYRGSNGRGAAYQRAIYADWGHHEVVDLLGAVDEAVRQGVADPERLGLGGWSYGGILTDYTIASDTRFKAAVSGAGSALQLSMYGSDQYIVQYEQELGPPWKSPEAWMKVSYPFFHADRISTPTLFMGGEKDFNVPIIGSEQMFQALRSLGVPTRLVVYPGQFHGLTTPSYVRDRLQRWSDWFDTYLKPAAPASGKPAP